MTPTQYHPGMAEIREQIKSRMKRLRVSQVELADRSGVSRANINRYLNGENDMMVDTLRRIAKALDMTIKIEPE